MLAMPPYGLGILRSIKSMFVTCDPRKSRARETRSVVLQVVEHQRRHAVIR